MRWTPSINHSIFAMGVSSTLSLKETRARKSAADTEETNSFEVSLDNSRSEISNVSGS
jgi:hypothetical protein